MRKQYVFSLLFRRLFAGGSDQWVLLGGNALLIRTGGGRFTKDIDLSRTSAWTDESYVLDELRELAARDVGDRFRFELPYLIPHDHTDRYGYGIKTAKISGVCYLGAEEFEKFSIDVSVRRHLDGPVDRIVPKPIIDHETLSDLPEIPVIPVENHLADKVCAMYELHHGGGPSTRYRDLADIVRIVVDLDVSAAELAMKLKKEQGRRKITLPSLLRSPHETWSIEYPRAARDFAEFPAEFHSLEASLRRAGQCLDPVLSGQRTDGRWSPAHQSWVSSEPEVR